MKQLLRLAASGLILIGFIASCSEFVEPSIKNKAVFLNSPAANQESTKYNQLFWWEKVEGARSYRLQIVSPSFDSIGQLLLDTLISGTKFNYTLEPGEYTWRVRGENAAGETAYSSRKFTIHQASISSQQVQAISPLSGTVSNQQGFTFKWYALYGADVYRLQIDTGNFENVNNLVLEVTTPNLEYTQTLAENKTYKWRIRAENDSIQSKWSAIQSFTFDDVAPAKVVLNSPANNSQSSKPISLKWNAVADARNYQLAIYKSDNTNLISSVTVTGTSYSYNGGESGETFYWKVRAVDAAGNTGEYSEMRSFVIQ